MVGEGIQKKLEGRHILESIACGQKSKWHVLTFGKPTMPICKLLEGRPSMTFLGASSFPFLGGMARALGFLGLLQSAVLDKKRCTKRKEDEGG